MIKRFIQRWLGIDTDVAEVPADYPISSNTKRARRLKGLFENEVQYNGIGEFNLRVYPASGGRIVEYRYYDEKTDSNITKLHIITQDQDLVKRLSEIMVFEELRK